MGVALYVIYKEVDEDFAVVGDFLYVTLMFIRSINMAIEDVCQRLIWVSYSQHMHACYNLVEIDP